MFEILLKKALNMCYSMFPIKRTVFLCTIRVVKNTVRLIGNIEYEVWIGTFDFSIKLKNSHPEMLNAFAHFLMTVLLIIKKSGKL